MTKENEENDVNQFTHMINQIDLHEDKNIIRIELSFETQSSLRKNVEALKAVFWMYLQ